jgi:LuxR family transcriptional regulator, maltose regulon positive regulatory protein
MAEAPGRTAHRPEAGGPGELLTTKLYVPSPRPGFVPRPRLLGRLDEGLAQQVTLVCAPAGFGKTALLADWAHRGARSVSWLALDAGDNDPARFWRHCAAALDRVLPGIAERVVPLLGPPAPPSFEGLVTVLVNELAGQVDGSEVLLVLDDYHLIEVQQVHASVTFLLEHLPEGLHVVLASRADPLLPMARWRARGQLAEVRAAELRFTTAEAGSLLREAVGPDLPEDAVAALASRTEGWAAGLQLAGLSLRGQSDVAALVASFSGSHRYILDYLTEEVLERQPESVRGFLLETSVLDRLSGALCNAVTGRTDGQGMLEAIERANLFLVPLDDVRGWWRYHHLFAELLRARLQQLRAERLPQLHRNAAAWCERHGPVDDAIRHALAADDPVWAARLIERHFDALARGSEGATVRRWIDALPPDLVDSRPRLLLARARMALFGGRLEDIEAALDAAERAYAHAADEPFEPSVGPAASPLANVPGTIAASRAYLANQRGDAEGAVRFATQALAERGEGEWMLDAIAHGHLSVAEWLRGRLDEGARSVASSIDKWRAGGEHDLAAFSCYYLGQVQSAQGRLDTALATHRQVLEIDAPPDRPVRPVAGVAYVGMAEVAYQRGELDTALRHVTAGITLCRQFVYTLPLATGLATLAWIRQAEGDAAAALAAMDEAEQVTPSLGVTTLLNPVPAMRARLLLAQGDVAKAAEWTAELGLGADDAADYPREGAYLVLARLLLAQDRPDDSLGLLERLHGLAIAQGRTGSVIEIQALRALALAACGKQTQAVSMLAEALTLGWPQGYLRVFADEGRPMADLVSRLVAAQRTDRAAADLPLDYLARLLRAFDANPPAPDSGPAVAAAARLIDALTARELEVLGLLAAGRSNRRIAADLYVTLDTVKKHVGHVLDKLGATNRTEAVARARQLGLIS